MTNIKNYKRYRMGVTDYYHRLKMLKNHHNLLRVKLTKKSKYYCVAFVHTPNLSKSDRNIAYIESRWIVDKTDSRRLLCNLHDSRIFGAFAAKRLNQFIGTDVLNFLNPPNAQIICDVGRRKNLVTEPFFRAFYSALDDVLKPKVKIRCDELDLVNLSNYQYR